MDDASPDRKLSAYCGLYCGACDIYRLQREARDESRTPEWHELPPELKDNIPVKPSPIRCEGCRGDDVFAGCSSCPVRACARRRHVEYCGNCASNPCIKLRLFGLLAWLLSFEKKLPHHKTKPANEQRIRCVGVDAWLREQDRQWRCPTCNTPFSWYRRTCKKCGGDLTTLGAHGRAASSPRHE